MRQSLARHRHGASAELLFPLCSNRRRYRARAPEKAKA
jgi:hypothetical protein